MRGLRAKGGAGRSGVDTVLLCSTDAIGMVPATFTNATLPARVIRRWRSWRDESRSEAG